MESLRQLEIKHVADLLDMHFHIPNYQRGYRWESKHIEDLLNDLYSFSIQMDVTENRSGKFYCIQPLAVVKNKELSTHTETVYDVIDGQQRLTTLYLLLAYLQQTREAMYTGKLATSIFSLKYESRDSDFFDNKEFMNGNISAALRNIDFFYLTKAYMAIKRWFRQKGINKSILLKILVPEYYKITTGLKGDELAKVQEQNDRQNDVRFIWYEVPAAEHTDSIEVFSQLNYGKTMLTATELVKALLFQCDIYSHHLPLMREKAFRRACEWDTMEKQLQDPFMWSMFMESEDGCSSHITAVLSLVCDELYEELHEIDPCFKVEKGTKDFIYQVCSHYLESNKNGDYAANVKTIWTKIQTTYTALYNWYKSSDTYHLVGLLLWLKEYKSRDFDKERRNLLIQELMREYSSVSKDNFVIHLKKQIAKIIHVKDSIKKNDNLIPWGLEHINYNDDALQVIRILVTFNVEDIRRQPAESSRFPFHLLRDYRITSLEHIHPQNLILDNIKLDTIRQWLEVKEDSLRNLKKYEHYSDDIAQLKDWMKDEASYKEHEDNAREIIHKIDKQFDDLANMKEEQMHTLYNMALVDKDLNAALSNHLLDKKRSILRAYHEGKKTYVLPATRKAFSKHYSPVNESNMLPKLWAEADRKAYFSAIKTVYDDFNSYYSKD